MQSQELAYRKKKENIAWAAEGTARGQGGERTKEAIAEQNVWRESALPYSSFCNSVDDHSIELAAINGLQMDRDHCNG